MKTCYLLLIICVAYSFNLFAQHYIGQDKIDLLKDKKRNSVGAEEGFKSTNFEVYLESASKHNGYVSDVKISFDKLKYLRGETLTLTFERTGSNARVDSENIYISGIGNLSGDGFELTKIKGYGYHFILKVKEVKKIFIKLKDINQFIYRIGIGIGKLFMTSESRGYVIPHTVMNDKIERPPVKLKPRNK